MPVIWTNDRSVLTQNRKGEIIKVGLDGKISIVRAEKTIDEANVTKISKDKCGNYELYPCDKDDEMCRINLQGKKIKQKECLSGGNGFIWKYEEKQSNPDFRQKDFFYNDKLIGKKRTGVVSTTDGYLAISYADRNAKIAGINIWNTVKNNWTNIEIKWHAEDIMLGWMEDK